MIRAFFILALCMFLGTMAFANAKIIGNGGDALVKRDPQGNILQVQAWDLFEGSTLRGFTYTQANLVGATWQDKVGWAFDRLKPYTNDGFVETYRAQALNFEQDARFLHGVDLVDIPDANAEIVPVGSKVEQLIIQKPPEASSDRWFTVNGDLWDQMSATDRAAMVVHEILYRAVLTGPKGSQVTDSVKVRAVNAAVWADVSPSFGLLDVLQIFAGSDFSLSQVQGSPQGQPMQFLGNNVIQQVLPYGPHFWGILNADEIRFRDFQLKLSQALWVFFGSDRQAAFIDAGSLDAYFNEIHFTRSSRPVTDDAKTRINVTGPSIFNSDVQLQAGNFSFQFANAQVTLQNFNWSAGTIAATKDTTLEIFGPMLTKGHCQSTKWLSAWNWPLKAVSLTVSQAKAHFSFKAADPDCQTLLSAAH